MTSWPLPLYPVTFCPVARWTRSRSAAPTPTGQRGAPGWRNAVRRGAAGVLVLVCAGLVVVATTAGWLRGQLLDGDAWTKTSSAIGSDPAVVDAVRVYLADEVDRILQPERRIEQVFPDAGDGVAGALAEQVSAFVAAQVRTLVASDTFQRTWVEANRHVHAQVVSLLRDDDAALPTVDSAVVLDLSAAVDSLVAAAETYLDGLAERTEPGSADTGTRPDSVDLAGTGGTLPRPGPALAGSTGSAQIRLFDAEALDLPRQAVSVLDRAPWLAWAGAVAAGTGAVLLSRRRWRAAIWVVAAATLTVALARVGIDVVDLAVVRSAAEPVRDAVAAASRHTLHGLRTIMTIELAIGGGAVLLLASRKHSNQQPAISNQGT